MNKFSCVGLDNPKFNSNIGAAMRAASCYNVNMMGISGNRSVKSIKSIPTNTHNTQRNIPILRVNDLKTIIPYDCVPVAVELISPAQSIINYIHPDRAFYIFGAEDTTLGNRVLSWCKDVIYIPTNDCMNLAATVNVVLYDRLLKERLNK